MKKGTTKVCGAVRASNNAPVDRGGFRDPAFKANRNAPIHRWVPWIAGYSKHFVKDALDRFTNGPSVVLDPFAGVGTTLVEADIAGHDVIGFEINPYAAFASQTKLTAHHVAPDHLREAIREFVNFSREAIRKRVNPRTPPPNGFRTRAPFYSPRVQHKVLLALDFIGEQRAWVLDIFRLAFAATMVEYSNYSYEPSLGRRAAVGRPEVDDYPVMETLAAKVTQMAEDVAWYRGNRVARNRRDGRVLEESFLDEYKCVQEGSVDLSITSPPYLNNYHYNRNTRPHLYWLGFCNSPHDLKHLEALNFGTYWQNARERERVDLNPAIKDLEVHSTLAEVRQRNPGKGIYGGPGWANYATRYFNDCARFVKGIKWCLRPGGAALVVLGNSILQGVPIPTDRFFAKIAEAQGLRVVDIHVPRDSRVGNSIVNSSVRVGAANGHRLYESVVELRRS